MYSFQSLNVRDNVRDSLEKDPVDRTNQGMYLCLFTNFILFFLFTFKKKFFSSNPQIWIYLWNSLRNWKLSIKWPKQFEEHCVQVSLLLNLAAKFKLEFDKKNPKFSFFSYGFRCGRKSRHYCYDAWRRTRFVVRDHQWRGSNWYTRIHNQSQIT